MGLGLKQSNRLWLVWKTSAAFSPFHKTHNSTGTVLVVCPDLHILKHCSEVTSRWHCPARGHLWVNICSCPSSNPSQDSASDRGCLVIFPVYAAGCHHWEGLTMCFVSDFLWVMCVWETRLRPLSGQPGAGMLFPLGWGEWLNYPSVVSLSLSVFVFSDMTQCSVFIWEVLLWHHGYLLNISRANQATLMCHYCVV